MAVEDAFRAHAETQESVRLLLAGFVDEIMAAGFALGTFLAEGDAYLAGFAALIVEDFATLGSAEVLAGAEEYLKTAGVEGWAEGVAARAIVREAMARTSAGSADFARGVAADFAAFVTGLRTSGMDDDAILAALTSSEEFQLRVLGRFRGGLKDMARGFVTTLDDVSYQAAFERRRGRGLPNKHVWVTRYDGKVCGKDAVGAGAWRVSCWHRHKLSKTYVEWQRAGLPGSGVTYCRRNCRCVLFPAARVRDTDLTDPLDIGEAMKGAQKRIDRRLREIADYAKKRAPVYRAGG